MATATKIATCTTTACAFNKNGCTAVAITVGGDGKAATCGTFVSLDARGGLGTAEGQVGACHRLECTHNKDLMCTSASISIVGDAATCEGYTAA